VARPSAGAASAAIPIWSAVGHKETATASLLERYRFQSSRKECWTATGLVLFSPHPHARGQWHCEQCSRWIIIRRHRVFGHTPTDQTAVMDALARVLPLGKSDTRLACPQQLWNGSRGRPQIGMIPSCSNICRPGLQKRGKPHPCIDPKESVCHRGPNPLRNGMHLSPPHASITFDPLSRVLFTVRSLYLCTIGLAIVFSLCKETSAKRVKLQSQEALLIKRPCPFLFQCALVLRLDTGLSPSVERRHSMRLSANQ